MLRPLGPGMMQQIQQRCSQCSGTGYATPMSDRCNTCGGTCLVAEKKVFEVHIEKVRGLFAAAAATGCSFWQGLSRYVCV